MKIVYIGQYRDTSGYGVAARKYIRALHEYMEQSGVEISLKLYAPVAEKSNFVNSISNLIDKYEFKSDGEIDEYVKEPYRVIWHIPSIMAVTSDLRFGTPPNCSPSLRKLILGSEVNIPLVAWETDIIPKSWTNLYDYYRPSKVIVPSKWSKTVFDSSYPDIDCDVVPHVIEDTEFGDTEPVNIPIDLGDKFVILCMSQWNNRKGFDKLIRAYCTEFRENKDTVLLIKTYGSLMHRNAEQKSAETKQIFETAKAIKTRLNFDIDSNSTGPALAIISDYLKKEQINWIYDKASVSSLLTRGEAFGFTVAESLMRETPVVVSSQGGHLDYISDESIFPVEGMWDMCLEQFPPYCVEGNWFECNIKSAQKQLRDAYTLWKNDNEALKQKGTLGRQYILKNGYDYCSIGEKLYNSISSAEKVEKLELTKPKTSIREKRNRLGIDLTFMETLQQKVDFLKDKFEGETCYILSCGPSLKNYDQEYLNQVLGDQLVFGIKTSYDYVPECVDFHFFNCSNLPLLKGKNNKEHFIYPSNNKPIVIGSSNYDLGVRWGSEQVVDLFFKVPIRTSVDSFLAHKKNFEEFSLSNQIARPCGPGIMLETVFYMAEHIGVKNIVVLGLDLTTNPKHHKDYDHFYDRDTKFHNPGDMLDWEIQDTRIAFSHMYDWLKEKGISMSLCSDISMLSNNIPRVRI